MAQGPQAFYCLWQEERILEGIYELLPKQDVCSLRLANSACCNLVTKRLFLRTHLTFTANSFTKASRIQALSRIGHHIQHLTFTFAHSEGTFLPPLVHPVTGHEISFLYTPYTHMASSLSRPKYGNSGLGDVLTQQYPPLFHSATNVPSFINAFKHLPNMRHLTIRCPGQDAKERYRRDIVDYALISLRISIERAPLDKLNKLTLSSVHPSAFIYLRHAPGFGCLPSASRRWRQIRKLYMQVDSWDFYGPSPGLDHLKMIEDYIRHLAPNLSKFSFTWLGRKGPCPVALSGDPLFAPPRSSKKLFNEVTSPMSPLPPCPGRKPIAFPRLKQLTIRNATMSAAQTSTLVRTHQRSVRDFDFENVALIGGGSWDDALAPLMDQTSQRGSGAWSCHSLGSGDLQPWGSGSVFGMPTTPPPRGGKPPGDDHELSSPSAAVAAASRELLDLDFEGLESYLGLHGDSDDLPGFEGLAKMPARNITSTPTIQEEDEEDYEDDDGLVLDIAAAKEASLSFSTKLQKKRIRRRRKPSTREDDDTETETQRRRHPRRKHRDVADDSDKARERDSEKKKKEKRERDRYEASDRSHGRHRSPSPPEKRTQRKLKREDHLRPPQTPPPMMMPEVILAEGDEVECPKSPLSLRSSPALSPRNLNISAPMLSREPLPSMLLLKPTVYDPCSPGSSPSATIKSPPASSTPGWNGARAMDYFDDHHDGLSPVQRNLEQEEAHRRLAEDADARTSALQKAKAAVMSKLTREFCKGSGMSSHPSPAVRCAGDVTRRSSGTGGNLPPPSGLMGFRLREGLFFGTKSSVSIAHSHQSMDSNSALVPLIISR
ncbi:hypothetical protein MCOR27_002793 [Pyricularia oryzae]|nr:hypothetical protein MCOR02_003927 [Pyricularia oryzae]KAI6284438.1 hypothetical protein MCOR27_002793 [Pyricularia oryzae]KAI6293688.1 hypothetical protein MCOR34_009832 [Pyricularia oryzae]KAI6383823.1 hypothetical protein MCOR32_002590 [Pyricularia oryzae]KAI6414347.1 hypothetical protein MCOR20_002250 [Pyricularia oryzae]